MGENNTKKLFNKDNFIMVFIVFLILFLGAREVDYFYQNQQYINLFFCSLMIFSFFLVAYAFKKSINKNRKLKMILFGTIFFSISFIFSFLYKYFPFKYDIETGFSIILMIMPFSLLLGAILDLIKFGELNATKKFLLLGINLSLIFLCFYTFCIFFYFMFIENDNYTMLLEPINIFNIFILAVDAIFFIFSLLFFIRKQYKTSLLYSLSFFMIDIFANCIKHAFF